MSPGGSWHGPLSPRKPGLFGVSGGLTVWSLAWLVTRLQPKRLDGILLNALAVAVLVEVALITLQYWRGVASHFNHATSFDAAVESTMLGLILFVSVGIVALSFRTFRLLPTEPAMALAIRSGMWLLSLSCFLGIATTILGAMSLAAGGSYELWGRSGVLKFPHGVALHAVQMLPFLAWLSKRLGLNQPVRLVWSALVSQIFFVIYAVWQTGSGRDRFDSDMIGSFILGLAGLFGLYPVSAIARGLIEALRKRA